MKEIHAGDRTVFDFLIDIRLSKTLQNHVVHLGHEGSVAKRRRRYRFQASLCLYLDYAQAIYLCQHKFK